MDSSPRIASIIINDLDQRLSSLQSTRVHNSQTLNDLEFLLTECSNQLTRLISSSDPVLVAILLPSLLHTIIALTKICSEKSDLIISGPFLSPEKLAALITNAKTLYNQIKEFLKSSKLNTILNGSTEQRHCCEQIHRIADSIANIDILLTLICHKLIVKLLTGSDDPQQSQLQISSIKIDDVTNGFLVAVYGSVLRQMDIICVKCTRDNKVSSNLKTYALYFQMLNRLIQSNDTISQIENYNEFIRTMIQLHICLESTCEDNRFQVEYFNSCILLQEILQGFISHSLAHSSKIFFDHFFLQLTTNTNKYASLIVLFRIIEAFDYCLTQQSNEIAIYFIEQLISHLFDLIDECRVQLVRAAMLPTSFGKTQVTYGSLYDITYSLLIRLFNHQPMQTVLSAMNRLIQSAGETPTLLSTSNQLASELIIQSYFSYNQSVQFQHLFGLFLAELLRLDIHASLVQHLLTMPNIRLVKFRAYDALISSDPLHRIYDLFDTVTENSSKEPAINSTNLSFIFPSNIDRLYPFVRLFNSEFNSHQLQHTIDTCLYSIQQFLSLPMITESTCRNFILTIRLFSYLTIDNDENFKCLLGQLTQVFVLLDEQTTIDVRLELLRLFGVHSNSLEDNDLGRLLDFILTNTIENNSNSIAFHIGCLDVVDSLRQRQARSMNITDLIIQLIVRYGNEHQCSHLLKIHLMRIFMAYISNGNDDSLPVRVKSQCILLRASVDGFEKSKKSSGTPTTRFPDDNTLNILDSTRSSMITDKDSFAHERDAQLKFYQTIVNELEFQQCSITSPNPDSMQQD